ncbi:4-hydroxythreonine-4-phosphate dehydrogenase PdxA [Pseudoruegeria sp. SHC-113]|uniref:4-hydroxythreonine-4-phosphate dehydrogenase PdxA n=1 Tax=Pseudoruegeria sp. SHC-113 TaxID=2855439 RepID=UPI0021BAA5D6|nr:4-hydroxythreonine-4-phosphate dehydrogenase PdxA [Pseudoruegeria sp. SHC-113]MCT8160609.1 4-hydroxythreonine-4-phosphate dehydrogenase PdxA [Pseudoruegeria sp. SHC-113]
MSLPPIALTCGDPAGIGPEIAAAAWEALRGDCPFFLIGDPRHLPAGTPVELIDTPSAAAEASNRALPVLAHPFAGDSRPGAPDARDAASVITAIKRGVELLQTGEACALCTNPIHKKALKDGAGFAFPGHTEFLAHLAGVERVVMMLASPALRVVPVTIHIAIEEVPQALTPVLLEETLRITHAALKRDFGLTAPRLRIAGLNPHAGEGGAMGREEINVIAPVLDRLRREGLDLQGPVSADTMFHATARAGYDAAICMYHDQALIPIKTLDFDKGVNVTLGLPFIRTSPDHGTAYDIAGMGIATPSSLIEALKLAQRLAVARANGGPHGPA